MGDFNRLLHWCKGDAEADARFKSGLQIGGHKPPAALAAPILIGSLVLGNMADMAYGNKLVRVTKEAEHILDHERAK